MEQSEGETHCFVPSPSQFLKIAVDTVLLSFLIIFQQSVNLIGRI